MQSVGFLKWIIFVITYAVIMACHQNAMKEEALEIRFLSVILDVYQDQRTHKDEESEASPEILK